MVKGRQGMYLEAWKFGVYITIPIFASWYYSYPENQQYWADYWQYIKYPENPNTNVRQKIKELGEQKEKEKEQRLAYQQQLRELQRAAERSQSYKKKNETATASSSPMMSAAAAAASGAEATPQPTSWWKRAGGWVSGSKNGSE